MRLDKQEQFALNKAIDNIAGEIFLFGSRTDDDKKGGDIDILIFSEENPYELSNRVTTDFFFNCEEKIDVVVMNPANLTEKQKAFLNSINKIKIK